MGPLWFAAVACQAAVPGPALGQDNVSIEACAPRVEAGLRRLLEIERRSGAFGEVGSESQVRVACDADGATVAVAHGDTRLSRRLEGAAQRISPRALSLVVVELIDDLEADLEAQQIAQREAARRAEAEQAKQRAAAEQASQRAAAETARQQVEDRRRRRAATRTRARKGAVTAVRGLWMRAGLRGALGEALAWAPGLALAYRFDLRWQAGLRAHVGLPTTTDDGGYAVRASQHDFMALLGMALLHSGGWTLSARAGAGVATWHARAEQAGDGFRAAPGETVLGAALAAELVATLELLPGWVVGLELGGQARLPAPVYGLETPSGRQVLREPWPVRPYAALYVGARILP